MLVGSNFKAFLFAASSLKLKTTHQVSIFSMGRRINVDMEDFTSLFCPISGVKVFLLCAAPSRAQDHHPCTLSRQQPHWDHDHPLQQHREGPVQSLHASGPERARVFAAETQWRTGVLRAAGHRQPHRRPLWENGKFVHLLTTFLKLRMNWETDWWITGTPACL